MATFRIVIQTEVESAVTGIKKVDKELNTVGKTADRLRNLIQQSLAFAGIGLGIKGITNLSDTYTKLQNRLKLVTNSNDELSTATQRLFDISQRTRTSFDGTVTLYTRMASATKNLGLNQDELARIVESVNQTVAISGATSTEAYNALIQFSQGIASARLGGEELRSVLEQLPAIADVIVASLNRADPALKATRGNLRELAAQGVVTPRVIVKAFQEAEGYLKGEFAKTQKTIGQAFQILHDRVLMLVGGVNSSTGVFAAFADAIIFLAKNLKTVLDILLTLSIAYSARFIPVLLTATTAIFAQEIALLAMARAAVVAGEGLVLLQLTMGRLISLFAASGPLIALVALSYVITRLITGTDEVAQAQARYNESMGVFQGLTNQIITASGKRREQLIEDSNKIIQQHIKELESLKDLIDGYANKTGVTLGLMSIFGRMGIGDDPRDVMAKADELEKIVKRMKANLADSTDPNRKGLTPDPDKAEKLDTFEATIRKLQQENVALGLNQQARELINKEIELEYRLKRPLTELERTTYENLLAENQLLTDKAAIWDNLREPQENLRRGTAAINSLLSEGKITMEEYNNELRRMQLESLAAGRDLETGVKRGLLTIQEQFGDIASLASETLVNSFQKAEDAFVEFAKTGKFSFKDMANSIISDLIRIQVRSSITGPLSQLLGSFNPFSLLGGSGGYAPGGVNNPVNAAGQSVAAPGFATGGSFEVGGQPGIDKNLIQFNATKGEMVNITKPGQSGGNGVTINVINNAPNTQARASEQSGPGGGKSIEIIVDEMVGKNIRKPGSNTNQALRQTFSVSQQLTTRS